MTRYYCLLSFNLVLLISKNLSILLVNPGGRFSKAPETFRARKAIAKSRTLRVQSCFIHVF